MVTLTVREEGSTPGNTVRHPVYVSQALYEQIERRAAFSHQSLSQWMRQGVTRWAVSTPIPQLPSVPFEDSLIRDRMLWIYLPPALNTWVNEARGGVSWSSAIAAILQWAIIDSPSEKGGR